MHETTADVRRDIEETRIRVSHTLAELQTEVDGRKEMVVERVVALRNGVTSAGTTVQESIERFAREHPWYALATALGIGLVVARSGVDEAAARAAADGTKRAAGAAASATTTAARASVDKAKGLVQRNGDSESVASANGSHAFTHDPQTGAIGSSAEDVAQGAPRHEPGLLDRIGTSIFETLGGDVLLQAMREEAAKIAGHRA